MVSPTEPALFVYCEGATEAEFIKDLRAHWRIPQRQVVVVGACGVPGSVVGTARKKQRELRERDAEVWAVFDRDEHPSWNAAIELAGRLGIRLAASNPCFELWAILLYTEQWAHLERHEAQHRLRALHAGYHHERSPYLELGLVLPGIADARRRCEGLRRRAEADGDAWRNPTSGVHALVDAIHRRVPTE